MPDESREVYTVVWYGSVVATSHQDAVLQVIEQRLRSFDDECFTVERGEQLAFEIDEWRRPEMRQVQLTLRLVAESELDLSPRRFET